MNPTHRGSCLCGAIRFSFAGPPRFVADCVCADCRRAHGASAVAWVGVDSDRFRLEDGEAALRWYASSVDSERGFCGQCGTRILFRSRRWPGETHMALACMTEPHDLRATGVGFPDELPPWTAMVPRPDTEGRHAEPTAQRIRPYRDSDEAAVVTLWQQVFPDDPPWNDPTDVIARKRSVQSELFLVAIADDQLVGTVLAGFDGVRGWVHKLAVAPEYRRRGLARQLMAAAEQGLTALGCPKVNLQVRATNTAVVDYYLRAGYAIEDRISMGKRLEG